MIMESDGLTPDGYTSFYAPTGMRLRKELSKLRLKLHHPGNRFLQLQKEQPTSGPKWRPCRLKPLKLSRFPFQAFLMQLNKKFFDFNRNSVLL